MKSSEGISRLLIALLIMSAVAGLSVAMASCSSSEDNPAADAGTLKDGATDADAGDGYTDFPSEPIVDSDLPPDLPSLFGADQDGEGPCLSEPPVGAMFPSNWTPPLFEWTGASGQNVFELRLSVDNQASDLVVYTSKTSYTVSSSVWSLLTKHSAGHDITVSVRGATLDGKVLSSGPSLGSKGDIHIAPVPAPGSVVYWTTSNASALKGFVIGATKLTEVISPEIIGGQADCIGCHTSSPDGKYAFFSRSGPGDYIVEGRTVDGKGELAPDSVVSPYATTLLSRTWQTMPVFSAAHYSESDSVVLTEIRNADTNDKWEIAWTDLHAVADAGVAAATGIIARTGDPGQPSTPSWSADGKLIAYTSSNNVVDGANVDTPTDIYTVPYADKAGGNATKLSGAADANFSEFYPEFSPTDAFIVFNRVPSTVDNMYDEPASEIFIVSSNGGEVTRLAANDPASCTEVTSPGLTNSWAKWAPEATTSDDDKYYWVIFSSKRRSGGNQQLFVAAVVTTVSGSTETIKKTYPAIYVTTQAAKENNHTPAWDVFQLPKPR